MSLWCVILAIFPCCSDSLSQIRLFGYIAGFDQATPHKSQKTNGMLKADGPHTFGFLSYQLKGNRHEHLKIKGEDELHEVLSAFEASHLASGLPSTAMKKNFTSLGKTLAGRFAMHATASELESKTSS